MAAQKGAREGPKCLTGCWSTGDSGAIESKIKEIPEKRKSIYSLNSIDIKNSEINHSLSLKEDKILFKKKEIKILNFIPLFGALTALRIILRAGKL